MCISGTVAKLDGQISKLDEHLSKSSATKRRKPRTPGVALAEKDNTHPFNKWLGCIQGSDSSRAKTLNFAAESDSLNFPNPLTLDKIIVGSPSLTQRRDEAARRVCTKAPHSTTHATAICMRSVERESQRRGEAAPFPHRAHTAREKCEAGSNTRGDDGVAGRDGHRVPDLSFHVPAALSLHVPSSFSSLSSWTQSRAHSPAHLRIRSPNFSASPVQGATDDDSPARDKRAGILPGALLYASDHEEIPDGLDQADLRRLEDRMEAKVRSMLQAVSSQVQVHSASKSDLETQVSRLREEMAATKCDVKVALKECRAARVAFASEHWSVKKLLEQLEDLKQFQRQELLELEQRLNGAPVGVVLPASSSDGTVGDGTCPDAVPKSQERLDSSSRQDVTRLEALVATLQRQVLETDAAASEGSSCATALKALVQEVYEKCDAVQQSASKDLADHKEESLRCQHTLLTRCDSVERSAEAVEKKMSLYHLEVDENVGRVHKQLINVSTKVLVFSNLNVGNACRFHARDARRRST